MKISLSKMPGQHSTNVVDFPRLDGGLNIQELDYRLKPDQSPEMKNLWWQDGILQCRDGQVRCEEQGGAAPSKLYACCTEPFHEYMIYHCESGLRCFYFALSGDKGLKPNGQITTYELYSNLPKADGTFFRYKDSLFYKNRGGFLRIQYTPEAEIPFSVSSVAEDAYVPTTIINASPSTGSGDLYQPENRLSPKKTVQYNAAEDTGTITKNGDGSTKVFDLGKTAAADHLTRVTEVYFGSILVNTALYTTDVSTGKVTFTTAPPADTIITFVAKFGVVTYQLPVKEVDAVTEVKVNGAVKSAGTDYAVALTKGQVVFVTAPKVSDPPTNNTVEITYSKKNKDAMNSIMDCSYAEVYGAGQDGCIVMGGCIDQPNAFFWSGNDSVGMNESYWPMSFYNLAGDSTDRITGFGKQYGTLVVFKKHSIGKSTYSVESVDGRDSLSLTYESINSKIGCDLPGTIQLIENNLVFCNTEGGVHIILNSTSALENNIECVSTNVNGTDQRPGLLEDIRIGEFFSRFDPDDTFGPNNLGLGVNSFDDGSRYWLTANGRAYVWDYSISDWRNPSWFYFTNIYGKAFFRIYGKNFHMDALSRLTLFDRTFTDYGEAIEKVYQFPPQFFDSYDRLKDILYCVFSVRSDTNSITKIRYDSDYETRYDQTDIRSLHRSFVPRDLTFRCLSTQRFAYTVRRKPACRHVRHFSIRLENNEPKQDLSIISAQIYFRYLGRDR